MTNQAAGIPAKAKGSVQWLIGLQSDQEQTAHTDTSGIFCTICEEGTEDQTDGRQVSSALGEASVTFSAAE